MAEGGGLLNRYRTKSSIGGSNPPLSAMTLFYVFQRHPKKLIKPQQTLGFSVFTVLQRTMEAKRLRGYFGGYVDFLRGVLFKTRF